MPWRRNAREEKRQAEEALQQSYERLRRALDQTIHALALTIEMRDPYTAGHQQRVAQLASAIARELGLPEEQIEGIRISGVLHDTGKIAIPSEMLSKPSRLSELEFAIMKTHPQVAYDILKAIDFPWPVAQAVLQHHERMNGAGYPSGLRGEEIILEARILAVADVVEAMSSHRPYRPALGVFEALAEILKNKNSLYDAQIVDHCLNLFTEHRFQFE